MNRQVVTLKDIAEQTGFGLSTVSLALRNHPSLRKSTAEAIQKAAHELGYAPNPLVSALMTQVRTKRRARPEKIALISRMGVSMAENRLRDTFYPSLYNAMVRQAEQLGFGIDEFYLGRDRLSDARISGILKARGIHGVLFFPGSHVPGKEYPELDWDHFSTVLVGFNTMHEELHQVVSDYAYDLDCAWQRIQAAGFRKIGFAVTNRVDRSTNHHWSSRFLFHQNSLPKRQQIPLMNGSSDSSFRTELLEWWERFRPEVILIAGGGALDFLAEAGVKVPADVRLINLVQRGEAGLAGINPHTDEVGAAAVELLVSLLQTNQFGLPRFPRTISVKGHWVSGDSFPDPR